MSINYRPTISDADLKLVSEMKPIEIVGKVFELNQKQEKWRAKNCLNMIASEGHTSWLVDSAFSIYPDPRFKMNDFIHRYAEGQLKDSVATRYYQGTEFIDQMEVLFVGSLLRLLNFKDAEIRPLSGNMANQVVYAAVKPDNGPAKNACVDMKGGGHMSVYKIGTATAILGYDQVLLPIDDDLNIDLDQSKKLLTQEKPAILTLGRSMYLKPEPVRELAEICPKETVIHYDAAHVIDLVMGKQFQPDLLDKGCQVDVLTASTHKTIPGAQRGFVTIGKDNGRKTPDKYLELAYKIKRKAFPGSTSNHHLFSMGPCVVALAEIMEFGEEYARTTVENARELGQYLDKAGIHVIGSNWKPKYTDSHQIVIEVKDYGGGGAVARRLKENNLVVSDTMLPGDPGPAQSSGERIGTQYITREGAEPKDMKRLAELYAAVIIDGQDARKEVIEFHKQILKQYAYTWLPGDLLNLGIPLKV